MRKLNSKTVFAALLFAGISMVSCKDKNSETEAGDTMGNDTGSSYDETQAPTGEPGAAQGVGADGGTGMPYDSTATGSGQNKDSVPSGQ